MKPYRKYRIRRKLTKSVLGRPQFRYCVEGKNWLGWWHVMGYNDIDDAIRTKEEWENVSR